MKTYEVIESPSELRMRISGTSMEALFKHALLAMFEVIEPQYYENSPEITNKIALTSADRDALLIDFLSKALYLSDVNNEAYYGVTFFKLTNQCIQAEVLGMKIAGFDIEIKAVTHHGVRIVQQNEYMCTELTFDI